MEADCVITAGQDRPRYSCPSCRFEHGVRAVDVGVQDARPVGLVRNAAEMDDRIDVLRGVLHHVEVGDICRDDFDSLLRFRAGYRGNVEQPKDASWPGDPWPQHRANGAGRTGNKYASAHVPIFGAVGARRGTAAQAAHQLGGQRAFPLPAARRAARSPRRHQPHRA